MISAKIRLAEEVGTLYEEREDYSVFELFSDIGGALGLVLGLSLIDIMVFGRHAVRLAERNKVTGRQNITYRPCYLITRFL